MAADIATPRLGLCTDGADTLSPRGHQARVRLEGSGVPVLPWADRSVGGDAVLWLHEMIHIYDRKVLSRGLGESRGQRKILLWSPKPFCRGTAGRTIMAGVKGPVHAAMNVKTWGGGPTFQSPQIASQRQDGSRTSS